MSDSSESVAFHAIKEPKGLVYEVYDSTRALEIGDPRTLIMEYKDGVISHGWYFDESTNKILCSAICPIQCAKECMWVTNPIGKGSNAQVFIIHTGNGNFDCKWPGAYGEMYKFCSPSGNVQDMKKLISDNNSPSKTSRIFIQYDPKISDQGVATIHNVFYVEGVRSPKKDKLTKAAVSKIPFKECLQKCKYVLTPAQEAKNRSKVEFWQAMHPPKPVRVESDVLFETLCSFTKREVEFKYETDGYEYEFVARKRARVE